MNKKKSRMPTNVTGKVCFLSHEKQIDKSMGKYNKKKAFQLD